MNTPAVTLAQVLPVWMQAKEDERRAIEHRRSLDQMIQSLLPKKDEGSVSQNEGPYKVSITYRVDRKLDTTALQSAWQSLPPAAQAAVKWKAELSATAFRNMDQGSSAELAKYITSKPASPTVSVDFKEAA